MFERLNVQMFQSSRVTEFTSSCFILASHEPWVFAMSYEPSTMNLYLALPSVI